MVLHVLQTGSQPNEVVSSYLPLDLTRPKWKDGSLWFIYVGERKSHVQLMSIDLLIPSFQDSRRTISLRVRSFHSKSPATQVANRQADRSHVSTCISMMETS